MREKSTRLSGMTGRLLPVLAIVLLVTIGVSPALADPLSSNRHIFINVANDAGVKYDLDGASFGGPSNTYYIKADGGGLNELHITSDASVAAGQVTTTTAQSGTLWVTNNGGRGYYDTVILMISVQDPIPDDFSVHLKTSGYAMGTPGDVSSAYYVTGAVDETFSKEDFIYGPQTWKPGPGTLGVPSLSLWFGQDITDLSTNSRLMFVDLNVGDMKAGTAPDLVDNGGARVEFSFTNLDTSAAFNGYGWAGTANQGSGISWTNRLDTAFPEKSSGYYVQGVERIPAPEFPTMALPAALIVGILGAVFVVRRTQKH